MLTDHGAFTLYTPEQPPFQARFSRNAAGQDFYDLRTTLRDLPDVTWLVVRPSGRVQLATDDLDAVFVEDGSRLMSLPRIPDPSAIQGKVIDLVTGALSDAPTVSGPTRVAKADIWRRATDAEAAVIDAALAARPLRERNIFRDAAYLSPDDEMFPVLRDGFVQAFGATRADQLLAPSVI